MWTLLHYTTDANWERIQQGPYKGLIPQSTLIPSEVSGLPDLAYHPCTFGILDAHKDDWNSKPGVVAALFCRIMKHPGDKLVCLELRVEDQDQAQIFDFTPLWRLCNFAAIPSFFPRQSPQDQAQHYYSDYFFSRSPIDRYQSFAQIPEVVIQQPIPLERISFKSSVAKCLGSRYGDFFEKLF